MATTNQTQSKTQSGGSQSSSIENANPRTDPANLTAQQELINSEAVAIVKDTVQKIREIVAQFEDIFDEVRHFIQVLLDMWRDVKEMIREFRMANAQNGQSQEEGQPSLQWQAGKR